MVRMKTLRDRHEARTLAMLQYLQETGHCRGRLMLQYFGETPSGNCGHCDICLRQNKTAVPEPALRDQLMAILRKEGRIALQELSSRLPESQREQAVTILRLLIEENALVLHPDHTLSATSNP